MGASRAKKPVIYVDAEHLAEAVSLLLRFDPEQHDPRDYVLTIAESIVAKARFRRGE